MKIKELFNKSNFGNYEKQFHSFREKIEMRLKSKMNHISFSENMITFYLDLLNKNEIQIKNCLFIIIHIPYQFSPKKFGDLIESIQKFILKKGFSCKNCFIIISGDEENFYNFVKDAFSNSVVLGGDKFDEILELDKPIEKIIEKLKSSLSEVAVSPFNYLGPCNPELFVGRTRLINDILRSTQNAYAIAGGRRIGKTSLLLKLYNTVRMKNTMPYSTIYIDSSIFSSFDELALDIQRRISPRDYYKKTRHDFSLHDIISRSFYINENKRIMLLIDEADSIISRSSISDANNFFKAIRSLSNQRIIKFVIAGYRKIFNLISDPTHPLYNLCEGVKLGMLNRQEVRHLISVPLHNLNIKLIEEEKIIKKINDFTGGHPSLVQFIGKKIFGSRKRDIIDIEIVENALNSSDILDFVIDNFMVNTTTIEKFLCILVRKEESFTIKDVFDKLLYEGLSINSDYSTINNHLNNLTWSNIIERHKDKYRFIYPHLQKKILEDFSSQEFIKYLKEDITYEDTDTIKLISGIEKSIIRDRDKDIAIEANLDIIMRAVHNIRNPAEIIHTMIEVLKRDYKVDNGVAEIINKIERQIIRIEELVYDFNRYIKPFEKRIKKIDIANIINDIINRFMQSNEHMVIKSKFEICNYKIDADEDAIKWAIEEIVKNAIKNKAHLIIIKLNSDFKRIIIHFEDDGVGIDEKYAQRIFDPFFTTDPTSTGLGLAVIKKIIEEHKGIIKFKKSISLSSCFIIDIPIKQ